QLVIVQTQKTDAITRAYTRAPQRRRQAQTSLAKLAVAVLFLTTDDTGLAREQLDCPCEESNWCEGNRHHNVAPSQELRAKRSPTRDRQNCGLSWTAARDRPFALLSVV